MINFVHTVESANYEIKTAKDLLSCFLDFCEENLTFSEEKEEQHHYVLRFMENMKQYKSLILTAADIIKTQTELLDDAVGNVTVDKTKGKFFSDFDMLGHIYTMTRNAADKENFLETSVVYDVGYYAYAYKVSADEVKKKLAQLISSGHIELVEKLNEMSYKVKLKIS